MILGEVPQKMSYLRVRCTFKNILIFFKPNVFESNFHYKFTGKPDSGLKTYNLKTPPICAESQRSTFRMHTSHARLDKNIYNSQSYSIWKIRFTPERDWHLQESRLSSAQASAGSACVGLQKIHPLGSLGTADYNVQGDGFMV